MHDFIQINLQGKCTELTKKKKSKAVSVKWIRQKKPYSYNISTYSYKQIGKSNKYLITFYKKLLYSKSEDNIRRYNMMDYFSILQRILIHYLHNFLLNYIINIVTRGKNYLPE